MTARPDRSGPVDALPAQAQMKDAVVSVAADPVVEPDDVRMVDQHSALQDD